MICRLPKKENYEMSNSLYYGELSAKIALGLGQSPDQIAQINNAINNEENIRGTAIYRICADAARVFDAIEDLSGELFVDWHKAVDLYADELLDHLTKGEIPHIIDLVSMASASIQGTRSRKESDRPDGGGIH